MTHLDEGTIHAWLDGGLNAAQAAEVEAHVQSCADCSAKVAEARGLIAASSRILTALDDVPANVTPKGAPVRRRRSITPWVSGLAAAVVLVTLWRAGGVEYPAPAPEIRIPEIPAPVIPQPTLSDVVKAPPIANAPAPVAKAPSAAKAPAPLQSAAVTSATLPPPPRVEASLPVAERAAAGAGGEDVIRLRRSRIDSGVAVADSRREMADEARRELRLAGCYRMPAQKSAAEALTTAAGAAKSVARARAPAGAAAPSAQMAPREAPLALIQLDTTATADGFALRDPNSGSVRGVWSPINSDSARVMLAAEGTFTFAIHEKVTCPGK